MAPERDKTDVSLYVRTGLERDIFWCSEPRAGCIICRVFLEYFRTERVAFTTEHGFKSIDSFLNVSFAMFTQ